MLSSADTKRPIVAFAHHPWVEPEWMNRQQILSRLGARGWPVVYSSGALDWWQRRGQRWASSPFLNNAVQRDGVVDTVPGRSGARWRSFKAYDEFALRQHAQYIRSQVARPDEKIIAMLFDPQFVPYIRHLEPCDVVYHAYDDFSGQPGWTDEKARLQRQLLERAAMVSASSEAIARKLNFHHVRVLENGADVEAFLGATDQPEPADLADIPHPRIGYIGTLNRKVDFPMIVQVARERPEWHWVLVGRIEGQELENDPELAEAFNACKTIANVHLLGQKHRTEIPAYVGNMNINIMCYRHGGSGWWNAGFPLKLHEYFSSGQPVISAPIAAIKPFSDLLYIAESPQDWISHIHRLLEHSDTRKAFRVAKAMQNSWNIRVDLYEKWLEEMQLTAIGTTG